MRLKPAVHSMPEGLQAGLTLQEFTDLIEYLVTLKQPASARMIEHGMPSVIQPLARPVAVGRHDDAEAHVLQPGVQEHAEQARADVRVAALAADDLAVQLDDVCAPFHTFMVFSESGDHVVSATILAQA